MNYNCLPASNSEQVSGNQVSLPTILAVDASKPVLLPVRHALLSRWFEHAVKGQDQHTCSIILFTLCSLDMLLVLAFLWIGKEIPYQLFVMLYEMNEDCVFDCIKFAHHFVISCFSKVDYNSRPSDIYQPISLMTTRLPIELVKKWLIVFWWKIDIL